MEQQQHNITALLLKHFNGQSTTAEEAELKQWINAAAANRSFYDNLLDSKKRAEKLALFQSFDQEKGWNKLQQQIPGLVLPAEKKTASIVRSYQYAAAAAVIILALSLWLLNGKKPSGKPANLALQNTTNVQPGGNKATLTLSNGRVVVLDSATGSVEETGVRLINFAAGQLSYTAAEPTGNTDEPIAYNILKTPPGGQYKLILPDGTQAWLNASSSLRFPTRFNGPHREVSLEGEAFFEVTPDASTPFYVTAGKMQVQVLGTGFNCMTYTDEPAAEITLVTGKIQVGDKKLLPGQQARLTSASDLIQVRNNVNIEEIIAWKNGQFRFQEADIQTVLRQIGRWYNLEIVYEGSISTEKFTGEIPRNSNIEELTRILRLSNIHFTIQNGKMIVKA